MLGARLAVDHLVHRGRRRIGAILGPPDMVVGRTRHEGYLAGLAAAGLEPDDALVASGDFSQDSGESAMRVLLSRRPDLDAVFCANDLMAAGALRVLREAGREVPGDVSVVGFDDAPLAQSTHPPLTTVHQSPEQMGREMVVAAASTPWPTRTSPQPPGCSRPGWWSGRARRTLRPAVSGGRATVVHSRGPRGGGLRNGSPRGEWLLSHRRPVESRLLSHRPPDRTGHDERVPARRDVPLVVTAVAYSLAHHLGVAAGRHR